MYTAPEVRELGTVSAFTLGSTHGFNAVTKANNSNPDFYSTPVDPASYGTPCTVTTPGGPMDCSTPAP